MTDYEIIDDFQDFKEIVSHFMTLLDNFCM